MRLHLNVLMYPSSIYVRGAPLVSGPVLYQIFSCGWHMCVIEVYGGRVQGLWFSPSSSPRGPQGSDQSLAYGSKHFFFGHSDVGEAIKR